MHVCSIQSTAYESFGRIGAQELITYIADIEALENAADLIKFFDGSVKFFQNPGKLQIQLFIGTLCLVPAAEFSTSESGDTDWQTVTSLRLDEITGFK